MFCPALPPLRRIADNLSLRSVVILGFFSSTGPDRAGYRLLIDARGFLAPDCDFVTLGLMACKMPFSIAYALENGLFLKAS
jgi:hypothetical protein